MSTVVMTVLQNERQRLLTQRDDLRREFREKIDQLHQALADVDQAIGDWEQRVVGGTLAESVVAPTRDALTNQPSLPTNVVSITTPVSGGGNDARGSDRFRLDAVVRSKAQYETWREEHPEQAALNNADQARLLKVSETTIKRWQSGPTDSSNPLKDGRFRIDAVVRSKNEYVKWTAEHPKSAALRVPDQAVLLHVSAGTIWRWRSELRRAHEERT